MAILTMVTLTMVNNYGYYNIWSGIIPTMVFMVNIYIYIQYIYIMVSTWDIYTYMVNNYNKPTI